MDKSVDILIIGGGLVGLSLALALNDANLSIAVIDAQPFTTIPAPSFTSRALALAPSSINILKHLHCWQAIAPFATTINAIRVSQQGSFGSAILNKLSDLPLGYVVELPYLLNELMNAVDKSIIYDNCQLISLDETEGIATIQHQQTRHKIKARLIVAADGAHSSVRQILELPVNRKPYQHRVITSTIGLTRAHAGVAFERFTAQGPLAMLPLRQQRAALVWSLDPSSAQFYSQCPEAEFLKKLQMTFGYRLGRLEKVGERKILPLQQMHMPIQIKWPVVFIGNAAHTLHPVAGQGFNLSLRDVATLVEAIKSVGICPQMLTHYSQQRHSDQQVIRQSTQTLLKVFNTRFPGLKLLRGLGLVSLDNSRWLKEILIEYGSGFGGSSSELACDE